MSHGCCYVYNISCSLSSLFITRFNLALAGYARQPASPLATSLYRAARSCRSIGLHCIYFLRPPAFRPGTPRNRRTGHPQQEWLGSESPKGCLLQPDIWSLWPMGRTETAALGATGAAANHALNLTLCTCIRYCCLFKVHHLHICTT